MQAVNVRQSCDLSRAALDREQRLDLVGLAAIDGRLAAFVVKRMNDHFEFFSVSQTLRSGVFVLRAISRRLIPAAYPAS